MYVCIYMKEDKIISNYKILDNEYFFWLFFVVAK